METVSTAGTDGESLEQQSVELARLIVELLRAGHAFTVQAVPNAWGAIMNVEIVFELLLQPKLAWTVQSEIDALKEANLRILQFIGSLTPLSPLTLKSRQAVSAYVRGDRTLRVGY